MGISNALVSNIRKDLESGTAKNRQDGVASLLQNFTENAISQWKNSPHDWREIFSSLFDALGQETEVFFKKGTAPAEKRLADVAKVIRFLVERSVHLWNGNVMSFIVEEIYRRVGRRGKLLDHGALDLLKALNTIMSHATHLDHTSTKKHWRNMVVLSLNVVLGDPPYKKIEKTDFSEFEIAAGAIAEEEEEGDAMDVDSGSPRKRRRLENGYQTKGKGRVLPTAQHEQVECMSLLATLMQTYHNYLVPYDAVIEVEDENDAQANEKRKVQKDSGYAEDEKQPVVYLDEDFPKNFLRRLCQCLSIIPPDSTLCHDLLRTVSAALAHLSLNRVADVVEFAHRSWPDLVAIWGTKNKFLREILVDVLHRILPYRISDFGLPALAGRNSSEGVALLWNKLENEAENRWCPEALSLEAIRLQLSSLEEDEERVMRGGVAFTSSTFRSGTNFNATAALAWSILQLRADCAAVLFQHFEAHTELPSPNGRTRKRTEDPVVALLSSLKNQARQDHLQVLLFFIDRHWTVLHDDLQKKVTSLLMSLIPSDDSTVQSLTFLCSAAIAHADFRTVAGSESELPPREWSTVWTHALRRASIPGVCRAACHAAHSLLVYYSHHSIPSFRRPLDPPHVLSEIETLVKDLDVQGPPQPSDSVCVFLAHCLRIASQDVQLYRMRLEDKVLTWLADAWRSMGSGAQGFLPLYRISDILELFETICGLSEKSNLICRYPLPDCLPVRTLSEEGRNKIIRDFLLDAKLPSYAQHRDVAKLVNDDGLKEHSHETAPTSRPATPRERRVSNCLQKRLDDHMSDWAKVTDIVHPRAEQARVFLDSAVIAICFESLLSLNGASSDQRVLKTAHKLMSSVIHRVNDRSWNVAEKAQVLYALDPLITKGGDEGGDAAWACMIPPGVGTGIKTQTLSKVLAQDGSKKRLIEQEARGRFQSIIWKNGDCKDVLAELNTLLQRCLTMNSADPAAMDVDERDTFTTHGSSLKRVVPRLQLPDKAEYLRHVAHICVSCVTAIPVLRSSSGEATRDKDLSALVMACCRDDPPTFLIVLPSLLANVRSQYFAFGQTSFVAFVDTLLSHMDLYEYKSSETFLLLLVDFLSSTMVAYCGSDTARSSVLPLHGLLRFRLYTGDIGSWRVRDALAVYLDAHLAEDSHFAKFWDYGLTNLLNKQGKTVVKAPAPFPPVLLPWLSRDADIRVRFRVAILNARLFAVARNIDHSGPDEMVYNLVNDRLCTDLSDYERSLTRLLFLGNAMVASSAIRKVPYWHLLETCLQGHPEFYPHVEAILSATSQRMGFTHVSVLFEAYASQIAFSIFQEGKDISQIPAHIIGYEDRTQCAKACFRSFTPIILLAGRKCDLIPQSLQTFQLHCDIIHRSAEEGIATCFGDIVAYQILSWFDKPKKVDEATDELDSELMRLTMMDNDPSAFEDRLRQHVDSIIISMLRTLSNIDLSEGGDLAQLMTAQGGVHIVAFHELTKYRQGQDFSAHKPNLPAFDANTILVSIAWLLRHTETAKTRDVTYHVLRELFANLHQTPLLNEQMRLISAITLWTAYSQADFADQTDGSLLHALIQGACSILGQPDLARSAQSLLNWAFRYYCAIKTPDSRFPDLLIRACCQAYDYTFESKPLSTLGADLLNWLDGQALMISKVPSLQKQIINALPAWPDELSERLSELLIHVSSDSSSAILENHAITSNKFRLVRRLFDQGKTDNFPSKDFWRLKECIPPPQKLHPEDMCVFAELLVLNEGAIHSLGDEQVTVEHKSRRDPKTSIVHALLELLDGQDPTRMHSAYLTLRSVMSSLGGLTSTLKCSNEERAEIRHLEVYPRLCNASIAGDLGSLDTDLSLLAPDDFTRWITHFATLLANVLSGDDSFYAQLRDILQSDPAFCQMTLPVLVKVVLESHDESMIALSQYFTTILSRSITPVQCLRSIIDTVLHLRCFPRQAQDELSYNKWLNVDFTLLAQKSISCGSYTTAVLFLELAADFPGADSNVSQEEIMYEIYSNIDEPDGFYGIKDPDHHRFLTRQYRHERQWDKAFQFHGADLEASDFHAEAAEGVLNAFHSFGFNRLAATVSQVLDSNVAGTSSLRYHLGWRTESWDLPDRDEYRSPGHALYTALRSQYRERDQQNIQDTVNRMLSREIEHLRTLGSENITQIREVAQSLMCLSQVAQWAQRTTRMSSQSNDSQNVLDFDTIASGFEFPDLEMIMATRISLLRCARKTEERSQIGGLVLSRSKPLVDIEKRCLLRVCEAAREARQTQIALNSIIYAQKLETVPSVDVSQEFAHILWLQHESKRAVQVLMALREQNIATHHLSSINARLGTWTAEACLEKPAYILQTFFQPAVDAAIQDIQGDAEANANIFHQCALFAENQYRATISSSAAVSRLHIYLRRIEEKEALLKQKCAALLAKYGDKDSKLIEVKTLLNKLMKQKEQDKTMYDQYLEDRKKFLELAIEMYSQTLRVSDRYDGHACIHLCSLWLANFEGQDLSCISQSLGRVPSHKFIFLAHQLSARLSMANSTSKNQIYLRRLILRMCKEHPFHTIYQVYSLCDAKEPSRRQAAADIFRTLYTGSSRVRVRDMELLASACKDWAVCKLKDIPVYTQSNTDFRVFKDQKISSIQNLPVPVITAHTPVDHTLRYDNCVTIKCYARVFRTAGGVNLPKIHVCYGTDGCGYTQLFKGESTDDLRQDAVMEQVFDLVNKALALDKETKKRKLAIRDYKVVPLASTGGAGVIEFVGNTMTISSWLTRRSTRKGWSPRAILKNIQDKSKTKEQRIKRWEEEIASKCQPVMRHYFTNTHRTPSIWFAKRLNYTRSVATTSIVGHVLGLGDRHTSNILLDHLTGEVVHIDLGIAFDQGKLLPVQETVPFRMTINIVDGMGISGTDGVFQRCAEETLRVLREQSSIILTVLEVFRHDPLHNWILSQEKMERIQPDVYPAASPSNTAPSSSSTTETVPDFNTGTSITSTSKDAEEAADRALNSVARKLDPTLSVTTVVSGLVAEATDPGNLSSIFSGWSPWL